VIFNVHCVRWQDQNTAAGIRRRARKDQSTATNIRRRACDVDRSFTGPTRASS
jgi:hypothetical protein